MTTRQINYEFAHNPNQSGAVGYGVSEEGAVVISREATLFILDAWVHGDYDRRNYSAPEDEEWDAGRRSITVVRIKNVSLTLMDIHGDDDGNFSIEDISDAIGEHGWYSDTEHLNPWIAGSIQPKVGILLEEWAKLNPPRDSASVTAGYSLEQLEQFAVYAWATLGHFPNNYR